MTRINTNVSSLVAQNRLQSSNKDLQTSLTRLSTGLRINSGADDAAGLIAAEALHSEVTGINKAISNTKRASQIVSTADSALGQVSNLLNDVRGLIVEAGNSGALSEQEIEANQLQIDSSLEAINRIAQTTTFQGRKLLDGSLDFVSTAGSVATLKDFSIDQANLGATGSVDVKVDIQSAATQAAATVDKAAFEEAKATATIGDATNFIEVEASAAGTDYNDYTISFNGTAGGDVNATAAIDDDAKTIVVSYSTDATTAGKSDLTDITAQIDGLTGFGATLTGAGATRLSAPTAVDKITAGGANEDELRDALVFQLNGTDGAETFNFSAGATGDQIAAAINLVKDSTGVEATYSTADGLEFKSSTYGSDSLVNVDIISEGSNGTFTSNLDKTRSTGVDIKATVNGIEASGKANTIAVRSGALSASFTVDKGSSTDFNFSVTGGGAQFQLGPQAVSNQQARLGIGSVSTGKLGGASGRLYELGSGQAKSLSKDTAGAAKIIDEVISKVTQTRGRLGAFQSTTLDSNLTSLNESAANLSEAESSIRDADFAQESANLTRAQILVQSGTNVLSMANQNPQNVLSLLR